MTEILNSLADDQRLLTREESEQLIRKVLSFVRRPGKGTSVTVNSWWNGERRWARNRVRLASDRRDIRVTVVRFIDGNTGTGVTNQIDDESLAAVVDVADRAAFLRNTRDRDMLTLHPPILKSPDVKIWSDTTYGTTPADRAGLAQELSEQAENHQLLSAGYLEMRGGTVAYLNPLSAEPDAITFFRYSQAQCSMTVRHPKGVGSGWAGLSSYDWSAIDGKRLAQRALDKCLASLNPVGIEPGRYTVVLEPQAVCDIVSPLMGALNDRPNAEMGLGPFALEPDPALGMWRTKLGLKVIDERITISHDPEDPMLGIIPSEPGLGSITWVDRGVLTALSYPRVGYSLEQLNENVPKAIRMAFRMSGGDVSMDDMIATTKRGLLVTRFSGLSSLNPASELYTGLTRDGLWLIENGKISKAVRNLRFTESPLFMLNQVEQLGTPVPVFRPVLSPYTTQLNPAVVPPVKARDFSFTSTVDAV